MRDRRKSAGYTAMADRNGREDRDQVRFVKAVLLGELADRRFSEACRERGLRPRDCIDAPLYWLSLPPLPPTSGAIN
jgi:hypothetical protein